MDNKWARDWNVFEKYEALTWTIAALIIAVVLWKMGWANIFGLLFYISLFFLLYNIATKKKKKNSVMAVIVCFILMGIFNNRAEKNELMNIYGMAPCEVEKRYGEPTSTESRMTGEAAYGYDGWYYIITSTGDYGLLLEEGNKSIMGVSIGDTKREVDRIMKKNSAYELPSSENDIKIFDVENYQIIIFFDADKVSTVQLQPQGT